MWAVLAMWAAFADEPPDQDRDGLSDEEEAAQGTDPLDADSDDDGLSDGDEVGLGTDPLRADTDGDGLPDGLELGVVAPVAAGLSDGGAAFAGTDVTVFRPDLEPSSTTDPLRADTDGDGLHDGFEDRDGNGRWDGWIGGSGGSGSGETDPTTADSDGDGLGDAHERFVLLTDPLDTDTDDGGVEDGVEVLRGTDPRDAADDAVYRDRDGDGLYDFEELALGTDPDLPDTDLDGLFDGMEVWEHGTDPLVPDTDGGGRLDGEEVDRGLDPLDPTDDRQQALGGYGGGCASVQRGVSWLGLVTLLGLGAGVRRSGGPRAARRGWRARRA